MIENQKRQKGFDMKKFLVIFFIAVCSLFADNKLRVIDFKSSPYKTNFNGEKWSIKPAYYKLNQPWFYSYNKRHICSKSIDNNEETEVKFQFSSGVGILTIKGGVESEISHDFLQIFLGTEKIYEVSGRKIFTFEKKITKQKEYELTFLYKKDHSVSRGDDLAYISYISYPTPVFSSKKLDLIANFEYTDSKGDKSWGNDDHRANTFETLYIEGRLKVDGEESLRAELVVPKHIIIAEEPMIEERNNSLYVTAAIFCTQRFSRNKIQLQFNVISKKTGATKQIFYSIPFQSVDYSQMYLAKQVILVSKKFDYTSKQELDDFLAKFPKSEFAAALFTFRLECCRRKRNEILKLNENVKNKKERDKNLVVAINEYIEFIEKYPNKLLAQVAIHECFELYTKINRISFYYNFIKRFPHSIQSMVAEKYIQALFYKVVCTENTVASYDYFIEMYPSNSFLTKKCIELAKTKMLQDIKLKLEDQLNKVAENPQVKENILLKTLLDEKVREKLAQKILISWENDKKLLEKKSQKLFVLQKKMLRKQYVIQSLFSETPQARYLALQLQFEILIKLNKKILQKQEQNHQKLMKELDQRFDKLEKSLEINFKNTQQQLTILQNSVNNIHKKLKWIHGDLSSQIQDLDATVEQGFHEVNSNLKQMEKNINDKLDAGFEEVNKYQQLLYNDLQKVNENVVKVNSNVLQMREDNKKFLEKNAEILSQVQKNGEMLTGWQNYEKPSGVKTFVDATITGGVLGALSVIPTGGPIIAGVAAPTVDFIVSGTTSGAVYLWECIF